MLIRFAASAELVDSQRSKGTAEENTKPKRLMKLKLTSLALLLLAGTSIHAATIISQWTFETDTPADQGNSSTSQIVGANNGNANDKAFGVHASGSTDWTTPAGSGSANSFSANTWAVGDYWQFEVDTRDFENISVSWDQMSSSTGPKDFGLFYSIDGSSFSQFSSSFAVGSSFTSFSRDLSAATTINDDASVFFRLVVMSGTAVNGAGIGTAGSSRIDNITVSGTAIDRIPVSTPDAGSSLFLLSLAFGGIAGAFRWRN